MPQYLSCKSENFATDDVIGELESAEWRHRLYQVGREDGGDENLENLAEDLLPDLGQDDEPDKGDEEEEAWDGDENRPE